MGTTGMMEHYRALKKQYSDCVVFYRLGDFYEMFDDDAVKVSAMLDLTLTGKDCGEDKRAPMCGIPFHAAEGYIAKLVSLGEKVAICEQLSQPKARELVKRDVVRIVTAGTVINSEMIDEKSNNFIACICTNDESYSISWADITTGEFMVKSITGENTLSKVIDLLVRINPAEIISDIASESLFNKIPLVEHGVLPKFNLYTESEFDFYNAENTLKKHFNLASLSCFNLQNDLAVSSSGALIAYLKETQKHALNNLNAIKTEKDGDFMTLDANVLRNLEIVKTLRDGKKYGSLLWLLDKTKTNMGARKLQNNLLTPLYDANKINERLDAVEAFYNNTPIRQSISDILSSVKDVGRIAGKISNGNLVPKDCLSLANSLENIPVLKFQLSGLKSNLIYSLSENLLDFTDLVTLLKSAIDVDCPNNTKDGGYIKEGYNDELDRLRKISKNGQSLINELESKEREKTGIKTLKIKYNRLFGYFIEITNSFKEFVPLEYKRRQTIANAERYTTEELVKLESDILSSDEKSLEIESTLFAEIKSILSNKISELKIVSNALAELDFIISLAKVAKENGYVRPVILPSNKRLNIVEGRHPVVEAISRQRFIPNDVVLDCDENRVSILTGPNMAGKSTYMRQTALIVLMAHIGSFVPASSAEIPLTDRIFTRVGASDNLILDQSTFMVEMSEVAEILNNATKNSLIILDEIGRGTSTYDGLSIAWAILEHIALNIKAKTMFATHYHELTELEGKLSGVKNYKVTVKELPTGIVFLRKITRGGANRSFGIEVSELAGVDKNITNRAREILTELERKASNNKVSTVKNYDTTTNKQSEVERILLDIDVNNVSPIQALNLLIDLKGKIR